MFLILGNIRPVHSLFQYKLSRQNIWSWFCVELGLGCGSLVLSIWGPDKLLLQVKEAIMSLKKKTKSITKKKIKIVSKSMIWYILKNKKWTAHLSNTKRFGRHVSNVQSSKKHSRQGGLRDAFMNVNIEVYWLHTEKEPAQFCRINRWTVNHMMCQKWWRQCNDLVVMEVAGWILKSVTMQMAAWWLARLPHCKTLLGSNPSLG